MIKTFTAFRPLVSADTHDENQRNAPDKAQYEGVIFSDGRCALRWLTAKGSTSVWDSMDDAMDIHGHSEYGTYLVWNDGRIENYMGKGNYVPRPMPASESTTPPLEEYLKNYKFTRQVIAHESDTANWVQREDVLKALKEIDALK